MKMKDVTAAIRNLLPLQYCGAVIVAAGNATRMGGIDKVMAPLCGKPMIVHTVGAFQKCDAIKEIVVVTRPELMGKITELCAGFDKFTIAVAGGKDRSESVNAGLNALSKKVELVAVQDGARPLITPEVIDRTVRAAHSYGAAAPAVPMKDTVKVVKGGVVTDTPDRSTLQAVQTPQVFDLDMLMGALNKVRADNVAVTDDCSAVEYIGMSVKIVEGDEQNIKVTTPMDLKIAQLLMEERK